MHRNIVISYFTSVTVATITLGGYIACGAQNYRVPVDDDTDVKNVQGQNTVSKTSVNGQSLFGVHSINGWTNNLPIRYTVSKDLPENVYEQIQKSISTWEAAIGKDLFQFDGVEQKSGLDFKSLYNPLDDDINGHYFDVKWAVSTGKPTTVLATTIWQNDVKDVKNIVKADIRYNSEYYFFGNSLKDYSQGSRIIVDLESLALHELGHLIGLTHISQDEDRYSVMNPSLFIGEGMITRKLSRGDIERIRSIYGVGDPNLVNNIEIADESNP